MAKVDGALIDTSTGEVTRINAGTDALKETAGGTGFTELTTGDLPYASAANTFSKLAVGTTGYALVVSAGVPAWAILGVAGGGTGIASYTTGDLPYASGSTTLSKLGIGSTGDVLTVAGGVPTWAAPSANDTVTKTATGAIAKAAPVYLKSDGTVSEAQANATTTFRPYGLAAAAIAGAASGLIYYKPGTRVTMTTAEWDAITGGSGGLTVGSRYFLSAATAGKLTATCPSSSGQQIVEYGVAESTTVMRLALRIVGLL
jgi:hypothetical protein